MYFLGLRGYNRVALPLILFDFTAPGCFPNRSFYGEYNTLQSDSGSSFLTTYAACTVWLII